MKYLVYSEKGNVVPRNIYNFSPYFKYFAHFTLSIQKFSNSKVSNNLDLSVIEEQISLTKRK